MTEFSAAVLSSDLALTLGLTLVSMAVVWIPFYRGMKVGLQALGATRCPAPSEIGGRLGGSGGGPSEPVTLQMLRVLRQSLKGSSREAYPEAFVVDASRQYVANEYDTHFARPISMYANILPPIGFIGTTCGLMILFLSMRIASDSLELGALAMALTSSVFALVGFALLEGFKIRLYQRMLQGLDLAVRFHQLSSQGKGKAAA